MTDDSTGVNEAGSRAGREVQLFLEVSQSLMRTSNLEDCLQDSIDRIMLVGPYDVGAIHVMRPGEDLPELVVQRGYRDAANAEPGASSKGRTQYFSTAASTPPLPPRYRTLAYHQPRVIEDLFATDSFRSLIREGARSLIAIPIRASDGVLGMLVFATRVPKQFAPSEVQLLGAIGQLLSTAIQNARLFEETRRAYLQLKAAEEGRDRLVAILEATTDVVSIFDPGGRHLYLNRAGRHLLGYDDDQDVAQTTLESCQPGWSSDLLRRDAMPTARRVGVWTGETALLGSDGHEIPALSVVLAHSSASETPEFFSLIARDIGELKQTQEALRRSEEYLRQTQKMEAVGVLAGGVAHDFNNLLTAIVGFGDLLKMSLPADDARQSYADEILKAGDRAAGLTRQLLAFSRRQVLQPQVLDLNAVVSDGARLLQRLIPENIEIRTNLEPDLGLVKADPTQLSQVIMNLAVNARDAMPEGGQLTIETANVELDEDYCRDHIKVQPGFYVRLAVSDTGSGMDVATRERIFEPFFTTKGPGKGTGLGLATVYGIVNQSEGHVWVYSELGHGTTFKVYLPLHHSVEERLREEQSGPGLPRGAETVLLVEDDASVQRLAFAVLTAIGYRVLTASRGEEAMQISASHQGPIDLLLTDLIMPGISGTELAQRMAALRPEAKVLYMSGYPSDVAVRHGVLQPEVAYLQKPFPSSVLARKVREVLDAGRSHRTDSDSAPLLPVG